MDIRVLATGPTWPDPSRRNTLAKVVAATFLSIATQNSLYNSITRDKGVDSQDAQKR